MRYEYNNIFKNHMFGLALYRIHYKIKKRKSNLFTSNTSLFFLLYQSTWKQIVHHPSILITFTLPNFLSHTQDMQLITWCNCHTSTIGWPLKAVQPLTRWNCGITTRSTAVTIFDRYTIRATNRLIKRGCKIPNIERTIARGCGKDWGMDRTPVVYKFEQKWVPMYVESKIENRAKELPHLHSPLCITHVIIRITQKAHQWSLRIRRCP